MYIIFTYSSEVLANGLIVLVDGRHVSNGLCKGLLEHVAVSCIFDVIMRILYADQHNIYIEGLEIYVC